jgi:hypothetical protein
MLKTAALVSAALMSFTASGVGMHHAGWFNGKASRGGETRQVRAADPLHSDAAMRYRHNQSANWRLVMAIR